ncbi:PriCT-2 domain-containing protein [Gammaproteobacteria bacterium]|nr:PriCT-2 domain-containing protein [Gammaproteobacteria bacterium]
MKSNTHEMWELFDENAGILELRGIKPGLAVRTKTISWHPFPEEVSLQPMFDDFRDTALGWDAAGYNVYGVFNDIAECFVGSNVTDKDIEARRYVLIDIDRVEKADCPATDAEVQHAIDLSHAIGHFMSDCGWAQPLAVMSGNGVHLYYELNYAPNTPELTEKIRALLQSLGDKFDNRHVKVDRGVYNASRITKVIGTTAKKGIESPGRPYRKIKILTHADSYGLRSPCFNNLLDQTLTALGFVRECAARPITKLGATPQPAALDDTPNNLAKITKTLFKISPDCDRHKWLPIVWSVLSTGLTGAEELARNWSIQSDRYTETDFDNLIRDYDPSVEGQGGKISIGTLYHYAKMASEATEDSDCECK